MNKNIVIIASIVIILVGTSIFVLSTLSPEIFLKQPQNNSGEIEKLTIGIEKSLLTSTFLVAENNGYFKDEGLDVITKEFDSGRNAMLAMFSDESMDMVTAAQTPIVFNSFDRHDYTIVATMAQSTNDVKLLARSDHGITTPTDLAGKKIGTPIGSTGHFFLELFLIKNNIPKSNIELIDINASELPDALNEGKVDGISAWEPHIYNAQHLIGNNLILFNTDFFREDFYFIVNDDFEKNDVTIKKFLKAVIRGENFIKNNPEESKKIISEKLGMDKEFINSVWNDFEFGITLDQSMLISLENEARWAIHAGYSKGNDNIPNYLEYINYKILEDVKPDVVNIIR